MSIADRFDALRAHARHRDQCDCDAAEIERHLDHMQAEFEQMQAELAEILTRLPAPNTTPALITVTAT